MEQTLRRKVFVNLVWRFLERTGAQFVAFVVSIILARILLPEQYGNIALVMVFISILNVFIDSGMGSALIQKNNADDLDFSSLFYFNIFMCIILYLIMFFSAPIIAKFYKNEQLCSVVRVISVVLIISGIKNIQCAYISKNLLFKRFFFATLGGTVGAAVIGISMAYMGYGIWALVAQHLFNSAVDTIILWFTTDWKPKLMFSIKRVKVLFSYGWKLLASALLDTGYNNLWQLVIGKMYSPADLAYYNKGNNFPNTIVSNVNNSIDSVLFPVMSEKQSDKEQLKKIVSRAISVSVFVMAPLMMGLSALAEPLIVILITEKWLPAVFFMRIFCVTYMFFPIHTANLNAIKALGRSDIFLKLEVIKKIVGFVALLFSMWFGVKAMAYSMLFLTITGMIINSWPNRKLLDYAFIEQMKDIFPSIFNALVMALAVYFIGYLGLPNILLLIIQIFIGAIIYVMLSIVTRNESFNYIWLIIKRRYFKKGV